MAPRFVDGAPSWIDLGAPDVLTAVGFYSDLFGWDAEDQGEEAGHYTMMKYQGDTVAAIGPCQADDTSSWTVYFKTADPNATTKAVRSAGGEVRAEPMDVFDVTTIAQYTDPLGARFASHQPKKPGATAARWNDTGAVAWIELNTRDIPRSLGFYRDVFGWTSIEEDMDGGTYTLIKAPDADQPFGGAFDMTGNPEIPADVQAHWMVYFGVDDCDYSTDRAVQLGATLLAPAKTVPGAGRFSILSDLSGAAFALIAGE